MTNTPSQSPIASGKYKFFHRSGLAIVIPFLLGLSVATNIYLFKRNVAAETTHAKSTSSTRRVLALSEKALKEVNSMKSATFRANLQEASYSFTAECWANYLEAFANIERFHALRTDKSFSSTARIVPGSAVILSRSMNAGKVKWVVELPYEFSEQSGLGEKSTRMVAHISVAQVPVTEDNPEGIAVERLEERRAPIAAPI